MTGLVFWTRRAVAMQSLALSYSPMASRTFPKLYLLFAHTENEHFNLHVDLCNLPRGFSHGIQPDGLPQGLLRQPVAPQVVENESLFNEKKRIFK